MKHCTGHIATNAVETPAVSIVEPLESRRLLSASAPVLANVATFADGNGTTTSNQYPGTGGGGWDAGWSASSKSFLGTVLSGTGKGQLPPIDLVQPDYLQVTASGTGAISRA